jgi:hypothetical protein
MKKTGNSPQKQRENSEFDKLSITTKTAGKTPTSRANIAENSTFRILPKIAKP